MAAEAAIAFDPGTQDRPDTAEGALRRIDAIVSRWARARPQQPALIDHDGRRVTWAELDDAVEAMARHLRQAGVRGGDRVGIVLENALPGVAALMACSRLDAWAVMLNARLAPVELERIHDHCQPRALVFTTAASREAAAHAQTLGGREIEDPALGRFALAGPLACEPEPVAEGAAEQVAVMIYTSGTTGNPKGVMLTHANVLFVATVSGAARALSRDDLVYGVLPISHVFGLSSTFLGTAYAGGVLQLVPRFDPAHLARSLAEGVTVFQGVPAMYARLLEHLDSRGEKLVAPRLRYMSAGGAPLDIDWKRRIEARFGIALNNGYGLTEAAPTIAQTLIPDRRDDDSVGPPLPGLEVRIVGANGRDMPEGEVGELWSRGPNTMKGYYRDSPATAAAVTPEGWLRTGDLARLNAQGNLFLVGRAKELIIRSGFNVYPPEVETALNAHPAVVQSAVIGRRVSGNEEVIAFVETMPGSAIDAAALQGFLAERLAPYKRPQHLFLVPRMPAGSTGKILKSALGPMAEELIARGPA